MLDPELQSRLLIAREYIDDCFSQSLGLQEIARRAHLSPFHFQRLFRDVFQITPHQYMTKRRIERTKELLLYTDLSISEICLIVGFQSLGSFSTLFSRETGLSPTAYRNRFGNRFQIATGYPDFLSRIPSCFLFMIVAKATL